MENSFQTQQCGTGCNGYTISFLATYNHESCVLLLKRVLHHVTLHKRGAPRSSCLLDYFITSYNLNIHSTVCFQTDHTHQEEFENFLNFMNKISTNLNEIDFPKRGINESKSLEYYECTLNRNKE